MRETKKKELLKKQEKKEKEEAKSAKVEEVASNKSEGHEIKKKEKYRKIAEHKAMRVGFNRIDVG